MQIVSPQRQTPTCSAAAKGCVTESWCPEERAALHGSCPAHQSSESLLGSHKLGQEAEGYICRVNEFIENCSCSQERTRHGNRIAHSVPYWEQETAVLKMANADPTVTENSPRPTKRRSCLLGPRCASVGHVGCGVGAGRAGFAHVVCGLCACEGEDNRICVCTYGKGEPSVVFVNDQGMAAQTLHCTQKLTRSVFADSEKKHSWPHHQLSTQDFYGSCKLSAVLWCSDNESGQDSSAVGATGARLAYPFL